MDKAIVMARGLGTRMQRDAEGVGLSEEQRELASRGAKGLIPIAGHPFLNYVIQELLDSSLTQICLVIGPDNVALREYGQSINEALLKRYGARDDQAPRIHFAVQEQPLGTANAVLAAREFADDDDVVVINSDNLYSSETLSMLQQSESGASYIAGYDRDSLLGRSNIDSERVKRLAVVQADESGSMIRIVEKPERPEDFVTHGKILLSLNCFRFSPSIFDACERIDISPRNEYELPSAVDYLMNQLGETVKVLYTTGLFIDLSSRADIAPVEDLLSRRRFTIA